MGLCQRQEPAVLAVGAPEREGVLPRLAGPERLADTLHDALDVIGVVDVTPAPAKHLLDGGAGVVVPALVVPDDVAVRLGDPGHLGQRVGEGTEVVRGEVRGSLHAGAPILAGEATAIGAYTQAEATSSMRGVPRTTHGFPLGIPPSDGATPRVRTDG